MVGCAEILNHFPHNWYLYQFPQTNGNPMATIFPIRKENSAWEISVVIPIAIISMTYITILKIKQIKTTIYLRTRLKFMNQYVLLMIVKNCDLHSVCVNNDLLLNIRKCSVVAYTKQKSLHTYQYKVENKAINTVNIVKLFCIIYNSQ